MKHIISIFFFVSCFISNAQQTDYVDFKTAKALIFDIHPESKKLKGEMMFSFDILKDTDSVFIDAKNFTHIKTFLNDLTLFEHTYDGKHIIIKNNFQAKTTHTLKINWEARPSKAIYFVGWDNEAPNQIWTQGQGKYTSNWLPSIDDTNDKIEFDLSISFNKDYEVISNGKLVNKEEENGQVNWCFDMKQPMSSYLAALVIGKFDKKVEYSKSGVSLEMYYYPSDSLKVEPTYRYTKKMFDFLEENIGIAYPWQNYKQVPVHDFLYAGMENTSCTIFSDAFMVDDIGFNDKNYVNVNAHELAHQWFGDFVTAKSGEHHWLQEGFATYYALLAEQHVFGDNYSTWKFFESAQQLQQQDMAGNGTSLLNPRSSSLTFYQRGAWVLYALKKYIGEIDFKEAVKKYLVRHQYKNVSTQDFIREVELQSGKNLTEFVKLWIENDIFPFDEAMKILKNSVFIQEYLMADCELVNSKCDYYLTSGISDEAKSKVIAQVPERVTSEVFKSSVKVRQSIAQNVVKVPSSLKQDYESLLKDDSYITIETTLYHLWINFPEDRVKYLDKTNQISGFNNKNVRQLWLALALSTPGYKESENIDYLAELISYTSPNYSFETRQTAFSYLYSIQGFDKESIKNLIDASGHHNWRFKSFSKEILEDLSKKDTFKTIIDSLKS